MLFRHINPAPTGADANDRRPARRRGGSGIDKLRLGRLAQTGAAGLSAALLLLAGFPSGSIERTAQQSPQTSEMQTSERATAGVKPQASRMIGQAAGAMSGARPKPAAKTKPVAAKPAGTSFGNALAEEYGEFVRREMQKHHARFRARHFTAKARRAAAGPVAPEDPNALDISGPERVALAQARSRLIAALERSARRRLPALAAKTQAKFDCWAERVHARVDRGAVLICREQYAALIALLEKAVMPLPAGSRFTRALTREYLAFADYEARTRKDWINARHFARKGLRAADATRDDTVTPEPLGRWNLHSRRDVPTFASYRGRLVSAFAAGARTQHPARAAVAQARFDCWVERTAGRAHADATEQCRREFLAALAAIESRATGKANRSIRGKHVRKMRHAGKRPPARPPVVRVSRLARIAPAAGAWTVLFGFDQDSLRAGELAKIRAVAQAARRRDAARVTVTGHADRAGAPDYNTGLSLRRAAAVRAALIGAGVAPDRVRIFARGEGDGAVGTGDGVGHASNRRVTITLR